MAARSLDPAERGVRRAPEVVGAESGSEREAVRYRLDVVAHSVEDVVRHAGGWIFDRAVAGWNVTVLVPGADALDARPVSILGARLIDLERVLAEGGQGRRPDSVAVAAAVCEQDSRAHHGLLRALAHGGIEVVVWGESWMSPPEHRIDPVVHRSSVAARAFKSQALLAAGAADTETARAEVFRTGASAFPPMGADLLPAS